MRFKTRFVTWTLTLAAVLGVASAVPAMAAAPTPGPSTNQQATISVPMELSLTTTLPATFNLTAANNNQATEVGGGTLTVQTNDQNGYQITLNGPQNNFVGQSNPGNSILINLVKAGTSTGGGFSALVFPPTQWASSFSAPSSSNGDQYTEAGFFIPSIPSNQAPDTYGGQINWILWGN